jgi:hypothetical protein
VNTRSARKLLLTVSIGAASVFALQGCGESPPEQGTTPAPSASDFPSAKGQSIEDLTSKAEPSSFNLAPAGQVFSTGKTRYSFAVLDESGFQVNDKEVALYLTRGPRDRVIGPFPASVESLVTDPSFRAQTTSQDPRAAKAVYVISDLSLPTAGSWFVLAFIKTGTGFEAAQLPTIKASKESTVAQIGEPAPKVHTPVPADVGGDISKIDTRIPADSMHQSDLADVLGKKPVVLLFSTPALCESRVCGPVVDIQAQVAEETGDEVEFIHSEIYNDNDANKGVRPPVKAFGLPTEPWVFAIDKNGVVRDQIEGAFGIEELRRVVDKASSQ